MRAILRDSELLTGRVLGRTYYRENKNENYVVCPPALHVWDSSGKQFTFGVEYNNSGEINVLCNGIDTSEFATRIEYHQGKVTLYGSAGRRVWNGKAFI